MEIDRDSLILKIRPQVEDRPGKFSEIELFQESTIKPVMLLQQSIIIFGFRTFLKKTASDFRSLSTAHQKTYINDRLRSDPALKNSFINYVVALFSTKELEFYTRNRFEIRKRIIDNSVVILEGALDKLA